MRMILRPGTVGVILTLLCCASAGAAPRRNDGVYQAATADRACALDLLQEIVNIDSVIPDLAEATLNVRYRTPEDFDAVLAKVEAGAGTTLVPDTVVTVLHDPAYPPLTENARIDALAARARSIYAEIGKTVEMSGNGGASESALAMAEGTVALDGLGYVGGDFHTDHEWIDLNSVVPRLYLFTRLLMETGAQPP
jgi:glutamate carboxypeptidase